jgi:hypothetical protein
MSTPAQFSSELQGMFAKARTYMDRAPREYIIRVATDLVLLTPGPGNQQPYDTPYIATGQLRGGWKFSISTPPGGPATVWSGGPEDESGDATISAIADDVNAGPFPVQGYLVNVVAYGFLVRNGLARHKAVGPRFWDLDVEANAPALKAEAEQKAMSDAGF